MKIVIPQFRADGADYYFVCDDSGSIRAVVFPSGNAKLRATEHD